MVGLLLNRKKLLADKRKLGRWGERRGERFLKRRGFRTLVRNFYCNGGEIDLIMVDADGAVVFVEVKARADEAFEAVEAVITDAKKNRMSRAARFFLAAHNIEDRSFRFDVVAIVLGRSGPVQIRHYENAFVP